MIACFWQAIPWATNAQIVQFVKQSADRFQTPDNLFGYGIPDFQLALNIANLATIENNKEAFVLYPNPTSSFVTISFPVDINDAKILFYNSLGQVVLQKTISKSISTLSLETLNSGVYYYKVQNDTVSQSGKIIKE
jgi:hypothetical protein